MKNIIGIDQEQAITLSRELNGLLANYQLFYQNLRGWDIDVKNNKSQQINMLLFDQVPVSTLEEIKVELSEISGGKHEPKTGEIKWGFKIDPSESKKFSLNYFVKYPKNRKLIIE